MKIKHILLTLSLLEFAIGFSNARQNAFFYIGLPLGAVLLALFLIATFLEKESALYDEQNRAAEASRLLSSALVKRQFLAQQENLRSAPLAAARSS